MGPVMIRDRESKTSLLITIGLLIIIGTRVQAEESATNILAKASTAQLQPE